MRRPTLEEYREPAFGQRWADKDWREAGRVIEVRLAEGGCNGFVHARVVAAPKKPYTVGRYTRLRVNTLRRRYRLEDRK